MKKLLLLPVWIVLGIAAFIAVCYDSQCTVLNRWQQSETAAAERSFVINTPKPGSKWKRSVTVKGRTRLPASVAYYRVLDNAGTIIAQSEFSVQPSYLGEWHGFHVEVPLPAPVRSESVVLEIYQAESMTGKTLSAVLLPLVLTR